MSKLEELQAKINALQSELDDLKQDPDYGILTRRALEIEHRKTDGKQYAIFADIDDMHTLNAKHGYEKVNNMIRNSVQVRHDDLIMTGRWFSGDEIVWVIAGDPDGFASRIIQSFQDNDMSITASCAEIANNNLNQAVDQASAKVQQAKNNNQRGKFIS